MQRCARATPPAPATPHRGGDRKHRHSSGTHNRAALPARWLKPRDVFGDRTALERPRYRCQCVARSSRRATYRTGRMPASGKAVAGRVNQVEMSALILRSSRPHCAGTARSLGHPGGRDAKYLAAPWTSVGSEVHGAKTPAARSRSEPRARDKSTRAGGVTQREQSENAGDQGTVDTGHGELPGSVRVIRPDQEFGRRPRCCG
jgi:hypothetical protein